MDKKPKQLTNYPKRQEIDKKSRNTYMRKLKEEIQITDNQLSTSSSTNNSAPFTFPSTNNSTSSTSFPTDNSTTRSIDVYVYGVGAALVLAVAACVLLLDKISS